MRIVRILLLFERVKLGLILKVKPLPVGLTTQAGAFCKISYTHLFSSLPSIKGIKKPNHKWWLGFY
jgi:hypothetical protein